MAASDEDDARSLRQLWFGELPESERLMFAQLPPARRTMALERLAAIRAYEHRNSSSGHRVADIAQALGITRGRFYVLLKNWQSERSLRSLVPHVKDARPRSTRLAGDKRRLVDRTIARRLKDAPAMPAQAIVDEVIRKAATRGLEPPSPTSVRRRIDQYRAGLADGDRLLEVADGRSPAPSKLGFGQAIIIDHTTADVVVREPGNGALSRPTLTLVIDQHTRLIIGHALSLSLPSARWVFAAMRDAEQSYQTAPFGALRATPGTRVRAIANTGVDGMWDKVAGGLAAGGFEPLLRRSARPSFGTFARRLIGVKLGRIPLLTRYTFRPMSKRVTEVEAETEAVLSLADASHAVAHAVGQYNRTRTDVVPDDAVRAELSVYDDGDEANRDWLAWGLARFNSYWPLSDQLQTD